MSKLKDIAKAANVSAITVSRVLNEPERVKPETKRRIEKVLLDMAYTPNVAAKNLVSKRVGVIGVYIPEHIDLSNPFVMYFITGVSEVLGDRMYSFLIRRSLEREHCCDGYIVTGLLTGEIDRFYTYARRRNRPIALFGHTALETVDCVDVDNTLGAALAVNYLIRHNHTRIGMINVDEEKDYTVDRYRGFRRAMDDAGYVVDPRLVIRAKNSINGGNAATKALLSAGKFTALFCATDTLAIGAINAANEAGLRVPESVSIAGFDGLGHHLLIEPHITTVRQPVYEVGKKLAHILLDRIHGKGERAALLLPPELLPGKTVLPVKKSLEAEGFL
jgi:LacI family transcriptional regulator